MPPARERTNLADPTDTQAREGPQAEEQGPQLPKVAIMGFPPMTDKTVVNHLRTSIRRWPDAGFLNLPIAISLTLTAARFASYRTIRGDQEACRRPLRERRFDL